MITRSITDAIAAASGRPSSTKARLLQRLMELEHDERCGAARHERSEQRINRRNGYRERSIETRIGKLDLKIPKLRSGSYSPSFLDPRKSSERALVAGVQEAYVKGISTRKVDDLVQAMGMSGISKSQVSRLCQELDQRVGRFLERPLSGPWPYLLAGCRLSEVTPGWPCGQPCAGGSGGSQRRGPPRGAGHGVWVGGNGGVLAAGSGAGSTSCATPSATCRGGSTWRSPRSTGRRSPAPTRWSA